MFAYVILQIIKTHVVRSNVCTVELRLSAANIRPSWEGNRLPTSVACEWPDNPALEGCLECRVGIPPNYLWDTLHPEIKKEIFFLNG